MKQKKLPINPNGNSTRALGVAGLLGSVIAAYALTPPLGSAGATLAGAFLCAAAGAGFAKTQAFHSPEIEESDYRRGARRDMAMYALILGGLGAIFGHVAESRHAEQERLVNLPLIRSDDQFGTMQKPASAMFCEDKNGQLIIVEIDQSQYRLECP